MQQLKAYILLLAYCVNLRHNLIVLKSVQIHSTRGTSNGTSTAALTNSGIDRRYATDLGGSVGHTEFLVQIRDRAVGAYSLTAGASVTHQLVGACNAGVTGELILGKQTDDLRCSRTCLRYGFGNILGCLNLYNN